MVAKRFDVTGADVSLVPFIHAAHQVYNSTRCRIERGIDKVCLRKHNCQDRLAPLRKFQCLC
jgi:hypothetical protein